MKRNHIHSDTFILQSDARIQDLDRELEILRQKRQIIQEQMAQKSYAAPYMSEPHRHQWNQPFQHSPAMVQYPIISQLKQFVNMNQNSGQHSNEPPFNQNPPRRPPIPSRLNTNPPRRPPIPIGRQKSPQRRPNPPRRPTNPPQRSTNPPPRSINTQPRSTNPPPRSTNPPQRSTNPPQRSTNPPQRSTNPPQRSTNPPTRGRPSLPSRPINPPIRAPSPPDYKKPKQRKRPRRSVEETPFVAVTSQMRSVYDKVKTGLVFRHNEEPNNQVTGRLELALGTILKSIRIEYGAPPHNVQFTTEGVKHLKGEIRKRVREVMVGKIIGNIEDTMEKYRKKYPISTDKEMVDSMNRFMETQATNSALKQKTPAEDTFRKHLKENFKITLDEFVVDMIAKMKTVCAQEEGRVRSELAETGEAGGEGDANAASGPSQPIGPPDDSQFHVDVDVCKQPKMLNDYQQYGRVTYYLISKKLPEVLVKHKDAIASLLDADKLFDKLYERKKGQLTTDKNDRLTPPIYLKVLGKPSLPPKKDTVLFLKHFNIVSLKKHTRLTNMLVAAVATKHDFEALMAANGVKLGNCSLYIQRSKSKNDDSCDFGHPAVDEPNEVEPSSSKNTSDLDEQVNNLLSDIRNDEDDDENVADDDDILRNAKKFKKSDGEAIDSANVFCVDTNDCDTDQVIDGAHDPETMTADSTNIDLSGVPDEDGIPTGFEVIDTIHDIGDEAPRENDSQATLEIPVDELKVCASYSDASTLEIGRNETQKSGEIADEANNDEHNIDVSNKSSSDVEIVETIQDVITIDDEADNDDVTIKDVKPVICEPRRSTRKASKNFNA